jgi:hypothetical protein
MAIPLVIAIACGSFILGAVCGIFFWLFVFRNFP